MSKKRRSPNGRKCQHCGRPLIGQQRLNCQHPDCRGDRNWIKRGNLNHTQAFREARLSVIYDQRPPETWRCHPTRTGHHDQHQKTLADRHGITVNCCPWHIEDEIRHAQRHRSGRFM